jgi:hypothetical protein
MAKDKSVKTYNVSTPLMLDKDRIESGDTVDLPADQARELLDCGAIVDPKPPKTAAPAAE